MKYILNLFILILTSTGVFGQINHQYNSPRSGDTLVKQQVEFKDPGREGEYVIWDFGTLKSVNEEYTLDYTSLELINDQYYIIGNDTIYIQDGDLAEYLVGTEHSTMYYLEKKQSSLDVLGHQNATTSLKYYPNMLSMAYPANYKESWSKPYRSEGLYSCRIPFESDGEIQQMADAYGVMVLPSGDTLKNVMRVKTLQTINETIFNVNGEVNTRLSMNVENYKWYSKGYRYPIFETVKTISGDSVHVSEFSTAFFFPPQEHLYLDTDPDNLAVLDSLWNIEHKIPDHTTEEGKPDVNFSYNFYPNPVETMLTVEYYLEQASSVTISLYNMDGRLVKTIAKPISPAGISTQQIDCSALPKGTYIISIGTNNKVVADKILKK